MSGYSYPPWAEGLGWVIALASVLCIPAGSVHAVAKAKGESLLQVSQQKTNVEMVFNMNVNHCKKVIEQCLILGTRADQQILYFKIKN